MSVFEEKQRKICEKFHVSFRPVDEEMKLGVARNFDCKNMPLNGLRHNAQGDTSGWYIWSGSEEIPKDDPDFFQPLHIKHLCERCPLLLEYLALPPGSRFLISPQEDYFDVWQDDSLLDTGLI